MAFAYPDPAADLGDVQTPNRSDGLPAGSGAPCSDPANPRPVNRPVDLVAIAEGFASSAAGISELHDPATRTWVLLAVTDRFEAWAIGWPPGGMIELHDHGVSHGAVAVAAGALTETNVRITEHGLALIGTGHITVGDTRQFGPHYVHDLGNDGGEQAISVHVYAPRLTTMTYYRLDECGRLVAVRTEEAPPLGPFDTTSDHDPS